MRGVHPSRCAEWPCRAPGLVPGLAVVGLLMLTYGGFLFSFALHLQAGLGDSALRAGLTFAPCALAFGIFWFFACGGGDSAGPRR